MQFGLLLVNYFILELTLKKSENIKTTTVKLATKSPELPYFMPMLEHMAKVDDINEVIKARIVKSCELLDAGVPLYPNGFEKPLFLSRLLDNEDISPEELEKLEPMTSAGRIMSMRSFGKVTFFHLQDQTGQLQCYASREDLGEEAYSLFKKFNIGDIVGVCGKLFKTNTGELTLNCLKITLLTRAIRPLPEKYHGLKDVEIRYRQRYVDMIVSERTRDIFRKRSLIVREFRHFMEEEGFLEVETPMLHPIAGGAAAKPFVTHHAALDMELYMRIAPELYLKRILVGGFDKVFELNRNFRNEGISTQHNPEFTMCEFYWCYATYKDLMDLTERLFARIAKKVCGNTVITYQGESIDLTPPWNKLSFYEALETIGGHNPAFFMNYDELNAHLEKRGEKSLPGDPLGKLQAKLFDLDVEAKLVQPHFIYHYPTDISPLARRNDENPEITDRFELFITGRELANAFSELNDPMDQRGRLEAQMEEKAAGEEETHNMDEDFLRALEYGMPPAAGEGIGIDRMVMLMTDSASIREVIMFPLLKAEQ